MTYGFLEATLDTRSSNGRDDVLLSELRFRDTDGTLYKVPKSADTDGASTPRIVWLIPGFEPTGDHWFDWILHDSGYRGTLLVFRDLKWVPANLSRLESDGMLSRSLKLRRMGVIKRNLVYRTIRAAGWKAYNQNRT